MSTPFLLRHSDSRVRIWLKEHESMYPSCLVSMVQAGGGGVMVRGIFSWHTWGSLIPIEHRLNATACLSIAADHVHPFMSTVYPSSDGYFQQDNAPCHKAQITSDWFLEHDKSAETAWCYHVNMDQKTVKNLHCIYIYIYIYSIWDKTTECHILLLCDSTHRCFTI